MHEIPLLKILKLLITYKIDVIDAYNMVFGLKTKLKFYFNDDKQLEIQRLSKGNRLTDEIIVKDINEEEKLELINIYMYTNEFKEFELEHQPEVVYDLIHDKESKEFTYKEE